MHAYGSDWEVAMVETARLVWILRKGEGIDNAGWRELLYGGM